jgi:hypothetical protein
MLTVENKAARIARAEQHARADRLVSGLYSDHDNHSIGCSVGCDAIDIAGWHEEFDNPHKLVSDHDGTPEWLERLRDMIFEGLPSDKRSWWHVELAKSLPVNREWQPYYHLICIGILDMSLRYKETWGEEYKDQCVNAIEAVRTLHKESAAWSATWSAESAESAARSAAYVELAEMIIAVLSSEQTE